MDPQHDVRSEDEELSDEMDDEMPAKQIYNTDAGGGYSFTTKLVEMEEDVTEIKGEIEYRSNIVGSLDGYLVSRGFRLNFFTSCDAVSAELQLLANVLFHQTGRLNKIAWHKEFSRDVLMKCSTGGFLNIDIIRVDEAHRGKDLGFRYLQHLFESLKGQWTISVIVPGLERSDLEGDARTVKKDHVCQLFARCGYKFLPMEGNDPYWYVLPEHVKNLSKNEVQHIKDLQLSNEHWSEYKNKLHSIHSMACFEEALVVGYETFRKRPADFAKAITKYEECRALMPTAVKNQLVEGWVAPRMFEQLTATAEIQTDTTRMEIEDGLHFTRGIPIEIDDLFMISMIEYIPEEVTRNGVYKSFLTGMLQVLETISTIMSAHDNRLPTTNRVMSLLQAASWPPSYRHFFEKGGRIEHILRGIIDISKEQSWAYGDGTYDEDVLPMDELETTPLIDILDNDFHYVETIFLKHLVEN